MKNINKVVVALLAYISLYGLIYVNNLGSNKYATGSILLLGLYIMILLLYNRYLNFNLLKKKQNIFFFFIFFSIFLSFTYVIGYNLTVYDDSYFDKIITYYYIISIGMLIYAFLNYIYSNINLIKEKMDKTPIRKIDEFLFSKKTFLKSFLLILLAWLPVLLAFYPGVFSYDSSVQFNEYISNTLSNANPVAHTLIIGKCLTIGHDIFNSYSIGVLIYSILQMLFLSLTMAYVIYYINKRKIPFIYKLFFLLMFMFLPTHSILSITTTKDVMFSCLVTLLVIKIIDMTTYTDEFFGKKKIINIVIYIILTCLLFMIRHNGLYGHLFLSLFLIIGLRKKIVSILVCVILPLILYSGYTKLINTYLLDSKFNNSDTTSSAALCIPLQQMARVYNYANLSKKEIKDFDRFGTIPGKGNGFKNYELRKSDAVGWSTDPKYFLKENSSDFIKTYFKYLKKYPKIYIDAFLQNTLGYFYIDDQLPDESTYRTYIEVRSRDDFNNTNGEIKFDSKFPYLYEKYYEFGEKGTFQNIPILSIFMSNAFYNLFMLFIIGIYLFKKRFNNIVAYMLPLGLMLTNLLGPVALLRYCYYLYLIFPIMVMSLYNLKNN